MSNPRPRLSTPSLVGAALVIICAQAASAQDTPRPAAVPPAPAAVAAKTEATPAKATEPAATATADATAAPAATVATDAAAAPSTAKPATAAPEKCACEVPDEPDPASSPAPAVAQGEQVSASANAPSATSAPALFPRAGRLTAAQRGARQQTAATWTPLTNEQKMKRAARNAFFNPIGIGRTFVSSAITQYKEDDQPHKTTEDEIADFGTRFAINFSRRATRTLLGSGVYPVLFNQDPRYDRAEEGTPVVKRVGHAISRVFVQRGDSGNLQPAASRWAGSLSASALSNLWERSTPGHDRIGTDATFKRFANSFVSDSINFLFVEFWPDIAKIFKR